MPAYWGSLGSVTSRGATPRAARSALIASSMFCSFDLHLGQGVYCVARSVGEAALDPIARGDRMRNAVHHG